VSCYLTRAWQTKAKLYLQRRIKTDATTERTHPCQVVGH
jgi:hypothetical protein